MPDGTVVAAGTPFHVDRIADGTYRVSSETRSGLVYVAGAPEARWAFAEGVVYEFEVAAEGATRGASGSSHEEGLRAPMPATVTQILVAPGQSVAQGDTVIILEAMKMELPIRAPRAGTVRAVHCHEGELVQPGVSLMEVD